MTCLHLQCPPLGKIDAKAYTTTALVVPTAPKTASQVKISKMRIGVMAYSRKKENRNAMNPTAIPAAIPSSNTRLNSPRPLPDLDHDA